MAHVTPSSAGNLPVPGSDLFPGRGAGGGGTAGPAKLAPSTTGY